VNAAATTTTTTTAVANCHFCRCRDEHRRRNTLADGSVSQSSASVRRLDSPREQTSPCFRTAVVRQSLQAASVDQHTCSHIHRQYHHKVMCAAANTANTTTTNTVAAAGNATVATTAAAAVATVTAASLSDAAVSAAAGHAH
jgi:hypothetical protein